LFLLLPLVAASKVAAQPGEWTASWIAHPDAPAQSAGVFHFRKVVDLAQRPDRLLVRISADNRYRLFVNGVSVSTGPARGDLLHWHYETVDLAPHLKAGRNVLAALVWNWGEWRPVAQMSHRTGFLLHAEDPRNRQLNSGAGWEVLWNRAYSFTPVLAPDNGGYYAASPGETIDARLYPWGWEAAAPGGSGWTAATTVAAATARGTEAYGSGNEWQLVPRDIPHMEERQVRFARVRRSSGIKSPGSFARGRSELLVPANSRVSILLDQDHLTMAYPVLTTSGGAGAAATITYAEALFDAEGRKGNRNEIEGKSIRGLRDRILFDGGARRRFQSLWLRTYRYVQLDIETGLEPLHIHDMHGIFTAYPFIQKARFEGGPDWIGDIWDIDWRIFRLSAFETFWDTPYYEQLQYVGDTRIESLLSLYLTGDDRLMRKAILDFHHSRVPEGLTASRYPSSHAQYIPPFSLWWIAMVHDHWMHRGDAAFARDLLPAIRGVIAWYEGHIDDNGMLGPMPWWNFLDWNGAYERGVPPGAEDGNSTPITFQFAFALQRAAELEEALGEVPGAIRYRALAARLNSAARTHAWEAGRGLFADTPQKTLFGQQTNALAVLAGAVPEAERKAVVERLLGDSSLVQASFYFRFYVDEAMREAGLSDRYLERLEPWREMLRIGLTTTPENQEPTRSDSHAWSAHPNYHLLATVLGVRPSSPGFRSVVVAPALGPMRKVSGKIAHPAGAIEVRLERVGASGLRAEIKLPEGVSGILVWNGAHSPLRPGSNRLDR
jgi:hypothetical protein